MHEESHAECFRRILTHSSDTRFIFYLIAWNNSKPCIMYFRDFLHPWDSLGFALCYRSDPNWNLPADVAELLSFYFLQEVCQKFVSDFLKYEFSHIRRCTQGWADIFEIVPDETPLPCTKLQCSLILRLSSPYRGKTQGSRLTQSAGFIRIYTCFAIITLKNMRFLGYLRHTFTLKGAAGDMIYHKFLTLIWSMRKIK